MRTKRIMVLCLITALMILVAVALCSCGGITPSGGNTSTQKNNNTGTGKGSGDSDGWKKDSTINNSAIYTALISGCSKVAYEGSTQSVEAKGGIMTLDSKIKISMGESVFWVTLLAKYNQASPRTSTMVTVELSTEERATDDSRVVSFNVFDDYLYLAVGNDNKLKFPIENVNWTKYFPYEMDPLNSSGISDLASAFVSSMATNKANTAYYRHGDSGDEWHYTIDIDLDATITSLFQFLKKTNKTIESINDIKKFLAVFLGVSEEDLTIEGRLPQSSVLIDFYTLSDKISQLSIDFDIDTNNRTKLFSDGKMKGSLSVEKLKIGSDLKALGIPFVNDAAEQAKYESFGSNTIFTMNIPLTEYKDGQEAPDSTILNVTTRVFQGMGEDDFIFAEYKDAATQKKLKGVYVYDNIAYFFVNSDGEYKCLCAFEIDDLGELATKVVRNDLNGTNSFDVNKFLAYIVSYLSLKPQEIKISLKPEFYEDVWYNFEDLCAYINTFTEEDLYQVEGINDFYNFVKTNEVIISFATHITFLDVVNSNAGINDVLSMLNAVGEDKFLQAAGKESLEEAE